MNSVKTLVNCFSVDEMFVENDFIRFEWSEGGGSRFRENPFLYSSEY